MGSGAPSLAVGGGACSARRVQWTRVALALAAVWLVAWSAVFSVSDWDTRSSEARRPTTSWPSRCADGVEDGAEAPWMMGGPRTTVP